MKRYLRPVQKTLTYLKLVALCRKGLGGLVALLVANQFAIGVTKLSMKMGNLLNIIAKPVIMSSNAK